MTQIKPSLNCKKPQSNLRLRFLRMKAMSQRLKTSQVKPSWSLRLTSLVAILADLGFRTQIFTLIPQMILLKNWPLIISCQNRIVSKSESKHLLINHQLSKRSQNPICLRKRQSMKPSPAKELASLVWALLWLTKVYAISSGSTSTRLPVRLLSRIKLPGKSKDAKRARKTR